MLQRRWCVEGESYFKWIIPCVHKRPVYPAVQLQMKDGNELPNAHRLAGIQVPKTQGRDAQ